GDDGGYVQQIELRGTEAAAPPTLSAGSLKLTHGEAMLVQGIGLPITPSGPLVKFQSGMTVSTGAVIFAPGTLTLQDRMALNAAGLVLTTETTQVRAGWATQAARMPAASPARAVKLAPLPPQPRATRIVLSADAAKDVAALPEGTPVAFNATVRPTEPRHTWNAVGK